MALNIDALLAQIEDATKQANNAGMERYQNLLNAVSGTKNSVLGAFADAGNNLATMGNSEVARIGQDRTRQLAGSDQSLISRGLGNTTVRAAARRGIVSDSSRAMSDVAERVANAKSGLNVQRAGALQQLGGMQGDAILSKQEVTPPIDLYASLIQQLMANQAASSGGGRSYNFMGGVPRGPNAAITPSYGNYGPAPESPGVQTFTNPMAQPRQTIRSSTAAPAVAAFPSYNSGGVQTFTRYS